MTSFDTQVQIEETIPVCPFCDKPIEDGQSVCGLHVKCYEQFGEEMDEYGVTISPTETIINPYDEDVEEMYANRELPF